MIVEKGDFWCSGTKSDSRWKRSGKDAGCLGKFLCEETPSHDTRTQNWWQDWKLLFSCVISFVGLTCSHLRVIGSLTAPSDWLSGHLTSYQVKRRHWLSLFCTTSCQYCEVSGWTFSEQWNPLWLSFSWGHIFLIQCCVICFRARLIFRIFFFFFFFWWI